MSRLDDALGGKNFVNVSGRSSQINDLGIDRAQLKFTRNEIKSLLAELINEEPTHEQSTLIDAKSLLKKVEAL